MSCNCIQYKPATGRVATEVLNGKLEPGVTLEIDPKHQMNAKDGFDVIPKNQAIVSASSNREKNKKQVLNDEQDPNGKINVGLTKDGR